MDGIVSAEYLWLISLECIVSMVAQ